MAAAVVLSAALINPVDSAAQRQRSPNGNGGQQRDSGGGGGRQRESGGGAARQRESGGGGGGQRSDAGARQQDSGRAQARAAQPRNRDGNGGGDRGRRESPPVARENAPPPRPPQVRAESAPVDSQPRTVRRRFPNESDRTNGDSGNAIRNRGDRGSVAQGRSDGGNVVRGDNGVRGNSATGGAVVRNPNARVAVPRTSPPPRRYYDDRYDKNVYGSYYGGRAVYGKYAYHGGRNIYIVPYGRTYYYYPRYYYTPYAFGYGPAGRGHFYFDLHYNSYIWHPYSVYRNLPYGSYGYPVGELRLKVHPRDAQVFIDGYYAGRVDEFDGVFQSLRLEEGEYQVEIVSPGYQPLAIDVRIFPGEKTTYEGDLIPE
jgi:23S rRNA pseudouridine2605 synthase